MEESHEHGVLQSAIEQAPCITFAQVRDLALKQGLTMRDLVAQFQEDVERPREVFARVWDTRLAGVVMPYWAVIQWYQKATAPVQALAGEPSCACGCGGLVRAWRKWASPACRKRVQRRARTIEKVAV
jgi:hypothetical protein